MSFLSRLIAEGQTDPTRARQESTLIPLCSRGVATAGEIRYHSGSEQFKLYLNGQGIYLTASHNALHITASNPSDENVLRTLYMLNTLSL